MASKIEIQVLLNNSIEQLTKFQDRLAHLKEEGEATGKSASETTAGIDRVGIAATKTGSEVNQASKDFGSLWQNLGTTADASNKAADAIESAASSVDPLSNAIGEASQQTALYTDAMGDLGEATEDVTNKTKDAAEAIADFSDASEHSEVSLRSVSSAAKLAGKAIGGTTGETFALTGEVVHAIHNLEQLIKTLAGAEEAHEEMTAAVTTASTASSAYRASASAAGRAASAAAGATKGLAAEVTGAGTAAAGAGASYLAWQKFLGSTTEASKSTASAIDKTTAAVKSFGFKTKEASSIAKNMVTDAKGVGDVFSRLSSDVGSATDTFEDFWKKIDVGSDSTENIKKMLGEVGLEIEEIKHADAFDDLVSDSKKASKGLSDVDASASRMKKSIDAARGSTREFGREFSSLDEAAKKSSKGFSNIIGTVGKTITVLGSLATIAWSVKTLWEDYEETIEQVADKESTLDGAILSTMHAVGLLSKETYEMSETLKKEDEALDAATKAFHEHEKAAVEAAKQVEDAYRHIIDGTEEARRAFERKSVLDSVIDPEELKRRSDALQETLMEAQRTGKLTAEMVKKYGAEINEIEARRFAIMQEQQELAKQTDQERYDRAKRFDDWLKEKADERQQQELENAIELEEFKRKQADEEKKRREKEKADKKEAFDKQWEEMEKIRRKQQDIAKDKIDGERAYQDEKNRGNAAANSQQNQNEPVVKGQNDSDAYSSATNPFSDIANDFIGANNGDYGMDSTPGKKRPKKKRDNFEQKVNKVKNSKKVRDETFQELENKKVDKSIRDSGFANAEGEVYNSAKEFEEDTYDSDDYNRRRREVRRRRKKVREGEKLPGQENEPSLREQKKAYNEGKPDAETQKIQADVTKRNLDYLGKRGGLDDKQVELMGQLADKYLEQDQRVGVLEKKMDDIASKLQRGSQQRGNTSPSYGSSRQRGQGS